jgi:hypothetical protein
MPARNAYRMWIPQAPPRDFTVEEIALFYVRRGVPTKTKLVSFVTNVLAGGPRYYMYQAEHIRQQPKAIKAISRLINAGVILRGSKWPHHIRLGV